MEVVNFDIKYIDNNLHVVLKQPLMGSSVLSNREACIKSQY